LMHREILRAPARLEVDHVNGDALDNRRCNLRLATDAQNRANYRKPVNARTSAFKGVTRYRDGVQWMSYIKQGGKRYHLGLFDSDVRAAEAYDNAARNRFGEFAWTNFAD